MGVDRRVGRLKVRRRGGEEVRGKYRKERKRKEGKGTGGGNIRRKKGKKDGRN
jgi:hypothetical protein